MRQRFPLPSPPQRMVYAPVPVSIYSYVCGCQCDCDCTKPTICKMLASQGAAYSLIRKSCMYVYKHPQMRAVQAPDNYGRQTD